MMTEVSLLEIKDFIAFAKEFGKNYADFSLAALRLRIQKICRENLNMRFHDFLFALQTKGQFREDVFRCIGTHPRDLFRDAGVLNSFVTSEVEALSDPETKVLIIDQSNFSDTINFVLSARMIGVQVRAQVVVMGFNVSERSQRTFKFNVKEIENAQNNFSTAFPDKDIHSLLKQDSAQEQCSLPDFIAFQTERMSCEPEFKCPETHDILISINNSLVYNYIGQQKFLISCIQSVKEGGRLFFGLRENFASVTQIDELQKPYKDLPCYVNVRK